MIAQKIQNAQTYLGIEFGSTRIKASLIDEAASPIASGSFEWENRYENGYWTYSLDLVKEGLRACFASLKKDVLSRYGVKLTAVGAMGISGMMHGYLPFDADYRLLSPFRTWRNTTAAEAADALSELFDFPIPMRWSIAHLYQAILDGEEHTSRIAHVTTLASYVHYLLTGENTIGMGEASGMFPIKDGDYDSVMLEKFDAILASHGYTYRMRDILPKVKCAGEGGAFLTEAGALLLDPTGEFSASVPFCPPEGDAGTGMVATNSVLPGTGNVSAGTSIFAMLVLDEPLAKRYPEIELAATPDGRAVAMIHSNNCSAELDAWVKIFGELAALAGASLDRSALYEMLYRHALKGDADCGGVTAYNYLSGEHMTGVRTGHPMYFRTRGGNMSLANFMRAQLYSSVATLKMGMDILAEREGRTAEKLFAHGGLFKVEGIAQQILANALGTPVSVLKTAGEGGAWGMALLASYMMNGKGSTLGAWLKDEVFGTMQSQTLAPEKEGADGFSAYMERYRKGLDAERSLEEIT